MEIRGRRRKQLLDDLKKTRGCWKCEEEALDRTLYRTRFGWGCGPVVRQTTDHMKIQTMSNLSQLFHCRHTYVCQHTSHTGYESMCITYFYSTQFHIFYTALFDPFSGHGFPHSRGFTITLRHTTLGRTPLDEWSAGRTDLYLTAHNIHSRQTSMPQVAFEATIAASERPKSHVLDSAAAGIGTIPHS
jgi:hypothetical protein